MLIDGTDGLFEMSSERRICASTVKQHRGEWDIGSFAGI